MIVKNNVAETIIENINLVRLVKTCFPAHFKTSPNTIHSCLDRKSDRFDAVKLAAVLN